MSNAAGLKRYLRITANKSQKDITAPTFQGGNFWQSITFDEIGTEPESIQKHPRFLAISMIHIDTRTPVVILQTYPISRSYAFIAVLSQSDSQCSCLLKYVCLDKFLKKIHVSIIFNIYKLRCIPRVFYTTWPCRQKIRTISITDDIRFVMTCDSSTSELLAHLNWQAHCFIDSRTNHWY